MYAELQRKTRLAQEGGGGAHLSFAQKPYCTQGDRGSQKLSAVSDARPVWAVLKTSLVSTGHDSFIRMGNVLCAQPMVSFV